MKRCLLVTALALSIAACTPAPAPEATRASEAPADLHARVLTLDTHLDTPVHFDRPGWSIADAHSFATDLSHVDLPRMRAGGLDGGFFVAYTEQGPLDAAGYAAAGAFADRRLAAIRRVIAANADAMTLALTADDAERIAATGRRAAFISVENSYPLGESVAGLANWRLLGVRMAGPVHNGDNQFADAASGGAARWGGLSPLGRAWVAEMNRLGLVIDGSHSSDAALRQMMALSPVPVVLSHSGFTAIFDHPRNVSDTLAREIAADGGVIHINSVFLSRYNMTDRRRPLSARMERMAEMTPAEQRALAREWAALDAEERINEGNFALYMRALLHCLRIVGVDHCGIGADWDGGGGVAGLADVTDLPKITLALVEAGYDEADVAKIWSGNILRVMRAAEAHASRR